MLFYDDNRKRLLPWLDESSLIPYYSVMGRIRSSQELAKFLEFNVKVQRGFSDPLKPGKV
jgi:hypothetical protein